MDLTNVIFRLFIFSKCSISHCYFFPFQFIWGSMAQNVKLVKSLLNFSNHFPNFFTKVLPDYYYFPKISHASLYHIAKQKTAIIFNRINCRGKRTENWACMVSIHCIYRVLLTVQYFRSAGGHSAHFRFSTTVISETTGRRAKRVRPHGQVFFVYMVHLTIKCLIF